MLRLILSNGEAGAEKAARATLKWRADKADMLRLAAEGTLHPMHATISKYSISETFYRRTNADEPVQLIRAGISNVRKLMDVCTEDEVVEYMNYGNRWPGSHSSLRLRAPLGVERRPSPRVRRKGEGLPRVR